jgi:hypothetical protein
VEPYEKPDEQRSYTSALTDDPVVTQQTFRTALESDPRQTKKALAPAKIFFDKAIGTGPAKRGERPAFRSDAVL